jgi:hypothetical protein
MLFAAVHRSLMAHLRHRPVPLGIPLAAPKRTWSRKTLKTAFDPGCVKTSKAWKPLEWSFTERSKSNTLANSRDHKRDPKECLFYRFFATAFLHNQDPFRTSEHPEPVAEHALGPVRYDAPMFLRFL